MTVPSTTRRAGPFTGTGALVSYPFAFKVFAKADLSVTVADPDGLESTLVLDSSFLVTLNGDQETTPGGSVQYAVSGIATALPAGYSLAITGEGLEYEQTADLPQGGNFNPVVIENALDRQMMLTQLLRDVVTRALQLSVTTPDGVDATLPTPVANNFIGWDSGGVGLRNIDPNTLATIVAFASWQPEKFSGDGVTTQFTLAADPGSIGNMDVSVGGVTQRGDIDFTLSGKVMTFTTAPYAGTNNIYVRYGQALPEGTSTLETALASTASASQGAVLVGIHDAAGRFQSTDVEKALAELDTKQSKSVFWYIPMALWPAITDGTGTTDIAPYINDAFDAVNAAGGIAELTFGPYRFRCDTALSCISSLTGSDKLNKRRLLQGRGAILDFRNGSWSADYTADAQIELFHFGCAPNTSSPGNPLTIIENGMAAIRDFVILGNEAQRPNTPSALTKPTTGTIGLRLQLAHDVQVENVLIENCTVGFETKDSWGLHMNSVRSRNCWIGLQANGGSTTAKWTNCFAVQCAYGVIVRTSLKSAAPYYGSFAGCSQQLFEGTRIEDCWYEYILYPHDTDIVGCHIVGGYSETSYGRDAIVAGFGFNQALLHDPASTLSSATTPTVDRLTVSRLGKMQFGGGFYALRTPSGGSANLKHSKLTLPVLRASVSGDMRSTILECIGQSSDGGGTVYYFDANGNDFTQVDMSTLGGKVLAYQLDLRDGIAAPTEISGRAITYVDTADGDLKVRFGDAVTKTLATDT